MGRKLVGKKLKPLINKKRYKKSKKSRVVYEYEKHISSSLRNMKIEDVSDSESSFSEENMPYNILALESSMGNKFQKCNLKTYSSYTNSRSLNLYRQSESKCIRFISINAYLQGKVSCTPNFTRFAMTRLSTFATESYNSNPFPEPKLFFGMPNPCKQNGTVHNLKCGNFGLIPNFRFKNKSSNTESKSAELLEVFNHGKEFMMSRSQLKGIQDIHQSNFKLFYKIADQCMFSQSLMKLATPRMSNERVLYNYENVCESSTGISKGELVPLTAVDYHSSNDLKNAHHVKPSEALVNTSKRYSKETFKNINRTISELLWLLVKMDRYVSIFNQYNFHSSSLNGINTMKLRTARLLKKYRDLLAKTCQSKVTFNENINICFTEKEKNSYNTYEVNNEETPLITITPKVEKERDNGSVSNITGSEKYRRTIKRNCKRKRQEKDIDTHTLKRSKLLDECIIRANATKIFNLKSSISSTTFSDNKQIKDIEDQKEIAHKGSTTTNTSSEFTCSENGAPIDVSVPIDPVDEEINKILSELPPLDEALTVPETFANKPADFGNATGIIHYHMGNGKTFVILPYADID